MTTETWSEQLANAVQSLDALCACLALNPDDVCPKAARDFPLRVPRAFVSRMESGNPRDPLLLQVLPQAQELDSQPGYTHNPLQEDRFNPTPGVLHKYHGRVLLTLSQACAVNCRYCFRRNFPYEKNQLNAAMQKQALDYIRSDATIHEVIWSGGDPLVLKDSLLASWLAELEAIDHVTTLRIHTRFPVVIPDRVTSELMRLFEETRLSVVVVVHCNHPNEIDARLGSVLQALSRSRVTVLNQTVLLRGVNDDPDVLVALSHRLFACGVLPYYLHVLDPVVGAAHFDLPLSRAREVAHKMKARLPGYLVPRLVQEVAGMPYKKAL